MNLKKLFNKYKSEKSEDLLMENRKIVREL